MRKMTFRPSVCFTKRLKIRDKLQYMHPNHIISFDSDNNLIIRPTKNEPPCNSSSLADRP